MGDVHVEYTATLAAAVGATEEVYSASDATSLCNLLHAIRSRHGDALDGRLFVDRDRLAPSVIAAVNDQQVVDVDSTTLHAGDRVLLLSAIGGG